jgi:hypothetical protein
VDPDRPAGQGEVPGAELLGKIRGDEPTDQVLGELARLEGLQESPGAVDQADPDLVGDDLAVQQPGPGLGDRHRLGQELVQLDDVHAAAAQLVDEVGVVALGHLDPHHVVE